MLFLACILLAGFSALAESGDVMSPSPPVVERIDMDRYLFLPTLQNWTDHSKTCHAYGGNLAFPKTREEADALWSIIAKYKVKQIHIGFHDQFIDGTYYAVKGRLITETNFNQWSSGAPVGGRSYNCGGLKEDGLVDVGCSTKLPAICEQNDWTSGGFKDYDLIPGHGYYKLFPTDGTWPEALMTCYKDGSHLLIYNSEAEFNAVFNKYPEAFTQRMAHVGAHHYFDNHDFVTIFDQSLADAGYSHWMAGEPNGDNRIYPILASSEDGLSIRSSEMRTMIICEHSL